MPRYPIRSLTIDQWAARLEAAHAREMAEKDAEIERLRGAIAAARERSRNKQLPANCKCNICGDEHYDIAGPAL